jgi:hypothetical protein
MKQMPLSGLMVEFAEPHGIVAGARRCHEAGYRKMDSYTPFPIEELAEAMGHHTRGRLPKIVLLGGIVGRVGGFALLYWTSVVDFPLNIGGRPFNSWPAFVPITFETTILGAAMAAVFGMLALNGLPMPYHPVFNVREFALASRDRFFLCIESRDPLFRHDETRRFLESLNPVKIYEVDE